MKHLGFQASGSWAKQVQASLGKWVAMESPGFQDATGSWAKQVQASLGKRVAIGNAGFGEKSLGRWAAMVNSGIQAPSSWARQV